MNGGWFPASVKGWPVTVERLQRLGEPFTEDEAANDLRWLVHQHAAALWARGVQSPTPAQLVAGVPGRPTLRARWNWTDHAVRTLLRDTAAWWDSGRWTDAPSPAHRQRTASAPPADRQPTASDSTGEPGEADTNRQRTASAPPADRQPADSGTPHAYSLQEQEQGQAQEQVEPTGDGTPNPATPLDDAPTELYALEDAPTTIVRGRVAPDPDAPTELQVAELVALQESALPSRSDVDAVTRCLGLPGVTVEVLRTMWALAADDAWWQETTDTGEPRLRWRSLVRPGPGLDKRIGAAPEAIAERARRAWANRPPQPPPRKGVWDPLAKRRFETEAQWQERLAHYNAAKAERAASGANT